MWLLTFMTIHILIKMVDINTSFQIWTKLHVYYLTQNRTKMKKLNIQIRTPKNDRSILVYLIY